MVEHHPLKPFIPEGARILMLGSFPPPANRWSMNFFYPNFINDMWRIFGLIFNGDKLSLTDVPRKTFRLQQIVNLLTEKGIAIYDTATAVTRLNNNASDKFLEIAQLTDIPMLLGEMPQCVAVAATGGKSAEEVARQLGTDIPKTGKHVSTTVNGKEISFYRMPSSSRAYPMSIERKAEFYRAMFRETGVLQ